MAQPGLWPASMHRPTASHAEIAVYEVLRRQLPNGWWAWHSFRIRTRDRSDAEADFVFAAPDRGLLVLEVKGGRIEVRDGHWYSNSIPLKHPPRDQANRFVRELIEVLKSKKCCPPAWGIATCFPDTEFDQEPGQADLAGRVLGAQDLKWLGDALMSLMDRVLERPEKHKGSWIQTLHGLWGESWIPRVRLGQSSMIHKEQMLRLDEEQLSLLTGLESNQSILVTGAAGTGKTILARAIATRLADQGKRVLLLCFTDALGKWLAEQTRHPNLETRPIKRYALDLLTRAGIAFELEDTPAFWETVTWRAAAEALPRLDSSPDVLIVDECQDLDTQDWLFVEELAHGGQLWGFRDPAQAFWPEREVAERLFTAQYTLQKAYRCAGAILSLAGAYAGTVPAGTVKQDAIEKEIVAIRACPSQGSVPEKIAVEVTKLLSAGLEPSDIAILSLRGAAERDSIVHSEMVGPHRLCRADAAEASSQIVVETFLRFKGLERPAIIVTDLHLSQGREDYGKRMYIALTRALDTVRIVDVKEAITRDPVLAPFCG